MVIDAQEREIVRLAKKLAERDAENAGLKVDLAAIETAFRRVQDNRVHTLEPGTPVTILPLVGYYSKGSPRAVARIRAVVFRRAGEPRYVIEYWNDGVRVAVELRPDEIELAGGYESPAPIDYAEAIAAQKQRGD